MRALYASIVEIMSSDHALKYKLSIGGSNDLSHAHFCEVNSFGWEALPVAEMA
jgi:hypothetical protein